MYPACIILNLRRRCALRDDSFGVPYEIISNSWKTGREILSQPNVWRDSAGPQEDHAAEIQGLIKERQSVEIFLTGSVIFNINNEEQK